MDVTDVIEHRIEVREYADEPVDTSIKRAVLNAGRLAPSGKNHQHWRFILIDTPDRIQRLADISTSGQWVEDAAFAVVVLTDPTYPYNGIDAGRAITHMQFQAWTDGVGSCIYTGYDETEMRTFLEAPEAYDVTAVIGFGYPPGEIKGVKRRRPLSDIAFRERFGNAAFEE
ncbi:MAG: nitroreductase family protein [Halobacteriales archaeon]|nr:nitroreductase family protein [Halobacteriales archaeon]